MFGRKRIEGRKQQSIFSLLLFMLFVVSIVGAAIGIGWILGQKRAAQKEQNSVNTNNQLALTSPSEPAKELRSYTAQNLFYKCETNTITEKSAWTSSDAEVLYQDLNNDGIEDALVSARVPGVSENVRACVFTVTDGRLRSLWRLNNNQLIEKSQIGVDGFGRIAYTGTRTSGTSRKLVTDYYLWSLDSGTFVLN